MGWQTWTKSVGKGNWIKMVLVAGAALALVKVFSPVAIEPTGKSDAMKDCLDFIPKNVKGLSILEGSRSKASIIRDMVPVMCAGESLFRHMQKMGEPIKPGRATFQVTVEFNGEVVTATVEDTTIQSKSFLNKIRRSILERDFVAWNREETDTRFVYPAYFGNR